MQRSGKVLLQVDMYRNIHKVRVCTNTVVLILVLYYTTYKYTTMPILVLHAVHSGGVKSQDSPATKNVQVRKRTD